MSAPFKTWTVLPHGKLTAVSPDILTVVGEIHMPLGEFPRRMTVVRLKDRRLVIFSAIALEEDEMAKLEAFGRPAFLIVPSERHRMDAPAFRDRYPDLIVIAPPGAREKVAQVVHVDDIGADFGDPAVTLMVVPGTKETGRGQGRRHPDRQRDHRRHPRCAGPARLAAQADGLRRRGRARAGARQTAVLQG